MIPYEEYLNRFSELGKLYNLAIETLYSYFNVRMCISVTMNFQKIKDTWNCDSYNLVELTAEGYLEAIKTFFLNSANKNIQVDTNRVWFGPAIVRITTFSNDRKTQLPS